MEAIITNELRIGSYLQDAQGRLCRVEQINISEFRAPAISGGLTSLPNSPIPLTEEWLIKFGWVWNEETKSYEKYPNGDARMYLQKREVNGSYSMFNYVLRATIAERIFFVHQLQNLYFALTGSELNNIKM